jgi:hypothetical protein
VKAARGREVSSFFKHVTPIKTPPPLRRSSARAAWELAGHLVADLIRGLVRVLVWLVAGALQGVAALLGGLVRSVLEG